MEITSKKIILENYPRGFNLITDKIINGLPEISNIKNGILFLFITHTSASLTINENSDYTVREDLESYFTKGFPQKPKMYLMPKLARVYEHLPPKIHLDLKDFDKIMISHK